jgi:beta-N-acetylglucosaminidase
MFPENTQVQHNIREVYEVSHANTETENRQFSTVKGFSTHTREKEEKRREKEEQGRRRQV